MSFQLAICRFGGLAALTPQADASVARTKNKSLEDSFVDQRDKMQGPGPYGFALEAIGKAFRKIDPNAAWDSRSCEEDRRVFSMPPSIDSDFANHLDYSSHLVGLLRSERMLAKIGKTDWIIRVRASVTACALEVRGGIPKLWWTFESIPRDPNPDIRPSEKDTTLFLSIVRRLEDDALKFLGQAYFNALAEVTDIKGLKSSYELGPERLRIRFADNDDPAFTALATSLRFRGLSAKQIRHSRDDILTLAKEGMREFTKFVKDTNSEDDPAIDADTAEIDRRINVPGVVAVSSRVERQNKIVITGIAQRPGARTAFDHLDMVGEQRFARNEEDRVRAFSAARRSTARLVADEALRMEHRRHSAAQAMLAV